MRAQAILAVGCVAWCGLALCGERWHTDEVLSLRRFVGITPRGVVVDRSGRLHAFYGDRVLYHAWRQSGIWRHEPVYAGEFDAASVAAAADGLGRLHVVCFARSQRSILRFTNGSGAWRMDVVDSERTGRYVLALDVAADADGGAHVTVCTTGPGEVLHITDRSGAWTASTVESVESGVFAESRIAVNPSGDVEIVVALGRSDGTVGRLRHARELAAGGFACEEILPASAWLSGFAVDSMGVSHIAWFDGLARDIRYLSGRRGAWGAPVTVEGDGGWRFDVRNLALALDPLDAPHLAFHRWDDGRLRYACRPDASWILETVDTVELETPMKGAPALAVDRSGVARLLYSRGTLGSQPELMYGSRPSAGSWSLSLADRSGEIGPVKAIAVDAAGRAHIAHNSMEPFRAVLYSKEPAGYWTTATAVAGGRIDGPRSIAVDAAGRAHVVCGRWRGSALDLVYAAETGGSWAEDRVFPGGGSAAAIALDAAGNVHITHFYHTRVDQWPFGHTHELRLVHAAKVSGAWSSVQVCTVYGNDWASDLAVDAAGKLHVALSVDGRASYLTNAGGSWSQPEFVGGARVDGWGYQPDASIGVDAAGRPCIAYFDPEQGLVMLARKAGGAWSAAQAASLSRVQDRGIVLAFAPDGTAHLALGGGDAFWRRDVLHCTHRTGSFETSIVHACDALDSGQPSLAVDPGGRVHIAFHDGVFAATRRAVNDLAFAEISAKPAALEFAAVLGGEDERTIAISNAGNLDLTVTSAAIEGPAAGQFESSAVLPFAVPPGEGRSIGMAYRPDAGGAHEAVLVLASNDERTPLLAIPLRGLCEVPENPELHANLPRGFTSFGQVAVGGASDPALVTIVNAGDVDLEIEEIVLSNPEDFVLGYPRCMTPPCVECRRPLFTLKPAQWCRVQVAFRPRSTGVFRELLTVRAGDPHPLVATVVLHGTGIPAVTPEIVVNPIGHDFGLVSVGEASPPLAVTIANDGEAELRVDISVPEGESFEVDPNGGLKPLGALQAPVPSGSFRTLTVVFQPQKEGPCAARLGISSNDPKRPEVAVALDGQGFADPCGRRLFVRGDVNDDGQVNLGDPITVLAYLFGGAPEPGCPAAADVNKDFTVNIADPVHLLSYLFAGGLPPGLPFPACGAPEAEECCHASHHCP